jgi:hypothetical protein
MKQFMRWMLDDRGKRLSLVVAISYIVIGVILKATVGDLLRVCMVLLLPLACIWFSDGMGRFTGFSPIGQMNISTESPGCLVALGGWILLLLPIFAGIIAAFVK